MVKGLKRNLSVRDKSTYFYLKTESTNVPILSKRKILTSYIYLYQISSLFDLRRTRTSYRLNYFLFFDKKEVKHTH